MQVMYSPAQRDDVQIIYGLCRDLIQTYETDPIPMDKVLNWCLRKIQTSLEQYRVITADGKKAGYVHLDTLGDGALKLDDLYVLTEFQGRGIGTQVVRDAISRATEQKKDLVLYVFRKNTGALRLYKRLGFRVDEPCGGSRYKMKYEFQL